MITTVKSSEGTTSELVKKYPITDALGAFIKVGQRVAYNLSGNLAIGTVTEVVSKFRSTGYWSYFKGHIKIRYEEGLYNYNKEHISTVKNPNAVIVLYGQNL